MRIAFTAKGKDWESPMDARFGRAEFLVVYDEEADTLSHFDNREIANVGHGAGPQTAQKIFDMKVDALVTGNGPGGNAAAVLNQTGIKIFIGAGDMTIRKAYEAYQKKQLNLA
ncbi:MAG: NifB/NifX family molybdenum-iron cluster-binding protein [Candidatus Cloacimonetes bacterium]|nr:NifB/NifX family molybdenum-iron cluster-binding protein [Candidatus Cloacimonadota bacterium]